MNRFNYLRTINQKKVFCIGFNKTGTTSLYQALNDLDYLFGDFSQGERLLGAYSRRDFRKITSYCKYGTAFKDVPFSLPKLFMALDQAYSGSKFILTVRESSEQWYQSITTFHQKVFAKNQRIPTYEDLMRCCYCYEGWAWEYIRECYSTPESDPYNKDLLIKAYENHIDDALFFFKNRSDDLLVLNVADEDSYLKMCKFLCKEPLRETFPWEKKTSEVAVYDR